MNNLALRNGILMLVIMISISACQKGSSPDIKVLSDKWQIQKQEKINAGGDKISGSKFKTKSWKTIGVPNTIMAGLVENGKYKKIYKDNNLEKADTRPFEQPWWYRKQFNLKIIKYHQLVFEGINYSANIWLNGKLIADTSKVKGAYGIWKFDVTQYVKKGKNTLAVQVFPPKADDLTIGFVDWNPSAPDKNMGIWRPVKLITTNAISMEEPFVKTDLNTATLNEASLTITTRVTNHSKTVKKAKIQGKIEGIKVKKAVELKPGETELIEFNPQDFPELNLKNPRIWWPNNMGDPNLYQLHMKVSVDNKVSDSREINFGIRKVEDYWVDKNNKGFKINGKKVLIKGAGWVDDLLLADSDDKVAAELEYVKHMNLNCIRLEGFWGRNQTLYDKADELGILIMMGWSCQWEWKDYCGRPEDNFMCIRTQDNMELQARAYQDQVRWLRNHPSIFTWVYGSDKLPRPELETLLNKYINEVDGTRPYLLSAKGGNIDSVKNNEGKYVKVYHNASKISGPSGVKMLGPYAYTAPNYWYLDNQAGGAYGFNTETGPGPQVPPFESVKKMISDTNLWPLNDVWNFHSGRHAFGTLDRYIKAFNARYGEANSAADFTFRSQISNYEAIRAMYEAFEVNKQKNATGVIQWMLNSAWPEMYWQLFDWYLMPNGAFYGTKKACQPLNAIYNYGDKNIYLSNDFLYPVNDINVEATVYDIHSKVVFTKTVQTSIEANTSKKIIDLPDFKDISTTYFLNLKISDDENVLATNFYWLSTKPDVNDWEHSQWYYTPCKEYADFTQLQSLDSAQVRVKHKISINENGDMTVGFELENISPNIAFFLELSIKDKLTGKTILPVFWDDNYISLMPGEKRFVSGTVQDQYILNREFGYSEKGLNVRTK